MIESFAEGFLLGLGAAIPLGPINILIMNTALKNYKSAVVIGIGAMSSDMFYLILILVGMIELINNPFFINIVGIVGSFFLTYLAYDIYKHREKKINVKKEAIKSKSLLKIYAKGFFLTLMNPYTIIFWFSVAGYSANRDLNLYFTLFGMISSIVLWITLMPYLVHKSKHKISQNMSIYLNIFSSFILLCFALMLFVDVVFL
ncbi:MAG: LysE family translocator [Sulfurimonas sp.]|uniref:LysE family translocator n=1 Tax=Sulfurimonas sp. TaxID=2022749 RepID=UPI003D111928